MRRDRDHYLFTQQDLHALIRAQDVALSKEIAALSNGVIQNNEESQLIKSLYDKYLLEPPIMREQDIEVGQTDTQIDVTGDIRRATFGRGPHYVNGYKFTYHIPFDGDPDLLKYQPSTFSTMLPYAEVKGHILVIEVEVEDPSNNDPDSLMQAELKLIKQYADQVVLDVQSYNRGLEEKIRSAVNSRKENLEKVNTVLAGSKYRVRTTAGEPTTYPTTSVERKTPIEIVSGGSAQKPEPVLPAKQYDHIIEVIKSVANSIERSPATYKGMGEEELRDVFLTQLNGHYKGKVTAEAFNAAGKTDILIRDQDKNVFIAECKIWGGGKLFTDTIDQLLGYTSWRDTKTALIIFNRNKNLTAVLEQIPNLVSSHANFKRDLGKTGDTDFRYVLHHNNDKARELFMAVLVVEVPV